jgi:hypothetical protein
MGRLAQVLQGATGDYTHIIKNKDEKWREISAGRDYQNYLLKMREVNKF